MAAIPRSATARLRKTFHYPTDDSSSTDTPEILDEDEQENLIQELSDQNEERNRQFRHFMLALPAISAIPYLLSIRLLLSAPSSTLPFLLGLSSLASTGWLLYSQAPTETGIALLDRWARAGAEEAPNPIPRRRRRRSSLSLAGPLGGGGGGFGDQRSPLETYLPLLNAGLAALLLLMGVVIARREDRYYDGGRLGRSALACLPAVVYGVVVASKLVMASVDPERELSALRYEHKGA